MGTTRSAKQRDAKITVTSSALSAEAGTALHASRDVACAVIPATVLFVGKSAGW